MSIIEKIKNFFSNIFSSKKALPEAPNNVEIKQENNFNESMASLVKSNKTDTETLIEQIKSREFDIENKSIEEIREIGEQLSEYLSKIKNQNDKLEEKITLYKQKLATLNSKY